MLDETFGFGPLEMLLKDPTISDILINGPNKIYVERRGKLEKTDVKFRDNDHLMQIIDRIVSKVGRRVDETCPMVDARLAGRLPRERHHSAAGAGRGRAVHSPLRRQSAQARRPAQLQGLHAGNGDALEACIKARLNIIISGGTGCGKTTLLNTLSSFIPHDERIVTIEDAAELQLQQDHVVRLETRPPNIEGKGAITTARPGPQRPAYAAGTDHHRRVPRRANRWTCSRP